MFSLQFLVHPPKFHDCLPDKYSSKQIKKVWRASHITPQKISFIITSIILTFLVWYSKPVYLGFDQDGYLLPKLDLILNPQLYSKDPVARELSHLPTIYYHLVYLISLVSTVDFALNLVHLVTIFLFVAAALTISINLANSLLPGILTIALSISTIPALGSVAFTANNGYPYQSVFAANLAFLCLSLVLDNRLSLSFFLAGLVFSLHPITGAWLIACLVIFTLPKFNFKHLLLFFPLASLLLFVLTKNNGFDKPLWLVINSLRSSHHLFPEYWSMSVFVPTLIIAATGLYISYQLHLHKFYKLTTILITVTFVSLLTPNLFETSLLRDLQLWRASLAIVFISLSLITATCYQLIKLPQLLKVLVVGIIAIYLFYFPLFHRPALDTPSADLRQVGDWLSTNSPVNTLIFVPPHLPSLRYFAHRSQTLTWADSTFAAFSPSILTQTQDLLTTYHLDVSKLSPSQTSAATINQYLNLEWLKMSDQEKRQLVLQSGATYLLLPTTQTLFNTSVLFTTTYKLEKVL